MSKYGIVVGVVSISRKVKSSCFYINFVDYLGVIVWVYVYRIFLILVWFLIVTIKLSLFVSLLVMKNFFF